MSRLQCDCGTTLRVYTGAGATGLLCARCDAEHMAELREVTDTDRMLPDGSTCGQCVHHARCTWLLGAEITDRTACDWYPVRYSARALRRVPCATCGELLAYDHTVCFACACR